MKVVARTDEYTIYQRRDDRYAVKGADRQWVNGAAKVAILVEHKLIDAALPKAQAEPEAQAEAAEAAAAEEAPAEQEAEGSPPEAAAEPDAADAEEAEK